MQDFYSNIHFTSIWWALFFPIVLIILDIFTGVVNAWKNNDFQSSIMRAGLSKKFGEIVYILVGILTKFAIGTDLILYFLVVNLLNKNLGLSFVIQIDNLCNLPNNQDLNFD